MSELVEQAFREICSEAKEARGCYVVLMEKVPFYGGPEEGGWWGNDCFVVAYQHFSTEEEALEAHEKILALAEKLNFDASRSYGEKCLSEMDWLESRGLEDDSLPQPNGENHYFVIVSETIPENSFGDRQYS